uniref:FSA_C domain-containing protein n=1 Tax=Heterorhabditis bacteriophora TaxID=37862 RepID=A0A1I7W8X0_HETBA
MHEQSTLVSDLLTCKASEKRLEIERRKLRQYELIRFKEFRRSMIEKLRRRNDRSSRDRKCSSVHLPVILLNARLFSVLNSHYFFSVDLRGYYLSFDPDGSDITHMLSIPKQAFSKISGEGITNNASSSCSGLRSTKRGCFYLSVALSSMPSETLVTPHLADYFEQVLEPLPVSSAFPSVSVRSFHEPQEGMSNIVAIDTSVLPLDVLFYLTVQSSTIRFDGQQQRSSAADCLLKLPCLSLMASTRRTDEAEYLGGVDISATLSAFSLSIYSPHQQNDLPTSLSRTWSFLFNYIEQISHLTIVSPASNRLTWLKEFIKQHTLHIPPDAQKNFFGPAPMLSSESSYGTHFPSLRIFPISCNRLETVALSTPSCSASPFCVRDGCSSNNDFKASVFGVQQLDLHASTAFFLCYSCHCRCCSFLCFSFTVIFYNFPLFSWAVFHIRHPAILFSPEAKFKYIDKQEGTVGKFILINAYNHAFLRANVITPGVSVHQKLIIRLGQADLREESSSVGDQSTENMATVCRVQGQSRNSVMRQNASIAASLDYLIGDVLKQIGLAGNGHMAPATTKAQHSVLELFQFPALEAVLTSDQMNECDIEEEENHIAVPEVRSSFICDFHNAVYVQTDFNAQVSFLPELLKSYIQVTDTSSLDEPMPKTDIRKYRCERWIVDPKIRFIDRFKWNPPVIDEVLKKLQIFDHRTTIPKALQRAVLDPMDRGLSEDR